MSECKEPTIYNKVCKYCGKEYTSVSRNQRYCSQECCDKAQVVNKKKAKKQAKKRKAYNENVEMNRLLSRAYSLAGAIGEHLPKVCAHKDVPGHVCSGPMELHHRDGNPFNNSPDNLVWLCRKAHEEEQQKLPEFSMPAILKEAFLQDSPQDCFHELVYERTEEFVRRNSEKEAGED